MRRSHLAIMPARREALQKLIELSIAVLWNLVHDPGRDTCEKALDGPYLVEQPKRIKR